MPLSGRGQAHPSGPFIAQPCEAVRTREPYFTEKAPRSREAKDVPKVTQLLRGGCALSRALIQKDVASREGRHRGGSQGPAVYRGPGREAAGMTPPSSHHSFPLPLTESLPRWEEFVNDQQERLPLPSLSAKQLG